MSCPRCIERPVMMSESIAAALYHKLRPYLKVIPSWGCYTPDRKQLPSHAPAGVHADWPLHSWAGPGHSPIVVTWDPSEGQRPTFGQFLMVYRIIVLPTR